MSWPVTVVRTVVALLTVCVCGALGLAACSSGESEEEAEARRLAEGIERWEAAQAEENSYETDPDGKLIQPDRGLSEPELPAMANSMSVAGAQEFSKYYIELMEYAWNTGETATLKAVSAEECQFCLSMITSIDEHYSSGGWADGVAYSINSLEDPSPIPGNANAVALFAHVVEAAHHLYDGSQLVEIEEDRSLLELHACWAETSWTICAGGAFQDDE